MSELPPWLAIVLTMAGGVTTIVGGMKAAAPVIRATVRPLIAPIVHELQPNPDSGQTMRQELVAQIEDVRADVAVIDSKVEAQRRDFQALLLKLATDG